MEKRSSLLAPVKRILLFLRLGTVSLLYTRIYIVKTCINVASMFLMSYHSILYGDLHYSYNSFVCCIQYRMPYSLMLQSLLFYFATCSSIEVAINAMVFEVKVAPLHVI